MIICLLGIPPPYSKSSADLQNRIDKGPKSHLGSTGFAWKKKKPKSLYLPDTKLWHIRKCWKPKSLWQKAYKTIMMSRILTLQKLAEVYCNENLAHHTLHVPTLPVFLKDRLPKILLISKMVRSAVTFHSFSSASSSNFISYNKPSIFSFPHFS